MSHSFEQILHAWSVQDPALVDMLVALTKAPDPQPTTPIPEDELTFDKFLQKINSWEFAKKHPDVQFAERVAMIAKLEADTGVYPLPDRYKIHLLLVSLWQDPSPYARAVLLSAIDRLPLVYGVWKGIKRIYKEAEARHDYEVFAHIVARMDCTRHDYTRGSVGSSTKTYMVLRAWRFLRKLGEQSAWLYPHVASKVLACYPAELTEKSLLLERSWVLNHICFHEAHRYGKRSFKHHNYKGLFNANDRAFGQTWTRDPEPLLWLVKSANSEAVRQFATDGLKHDFATALRQVDVATINELSAINKASVARDELIVWLLTNSPNFEQSKFKVLGLHDVVLKLLFSGFEQAYLYAFDYVKSHAPDLPLSTLLFLANSNYPKVRTFAIEQILILDPRKVVGIDGWGQLLNSSYHHEIAAKQLISHFNRRDFTPEWFYERLLSDNVHSKNFARTNVTQIFSLKELGTAFFMRVARAIEGDDNYNQSSVLDFALDSLRELGVADVSAEFWQIMLLHPQVSENVESLIDENVLPADSLPLDFWQAIASEADWQKNAWVQDFITPKADDVTTWQRRLAFNEELQTTALYYLADVRRFVPAGLGFDWLMSLVQSDKFALREFAIERINKGFIPADFAPKSDIKAETKADANADLGGQSFLFTGKLATMTRGEAENQVKDHNGVNSGSVTAKLDFLVIGDDGSPLYGNGRKGSKQVKAESLIDKGAGIRIISETAFLQMLSGQSRQVDDNQTEQGAQVLWQMATDTQNHAKSALAIHYLSRHHQKLCMELTDRPVDPDAVIAGEFFSADKVIPLFGRGNPELREFALNLAKYEFVHWQISDTQWLEMAQSPHQDVKDFITTALFADKTNANHTYHYDKDKLSASMLYTLLDSSVFFARQLGVNLLLKYPEFRDVDTLYRLTESVDRGVRHASVKMLWQHQRKHKSAMSADSDSLLMLLKRGLFELPPARLTTPDNTPKPENSEPMPKPISASRAKIALIETFRDVALADESFARHIMPTLQSFVVSAGKMERQACLVATTRLLHAYPNLKEVS